MRSLFCVCLLSCAVGALAAEPGASAQPASVAAPALDGEWVVDLSTDPAKPYTQPMSLTLAADGRVTGSFYRSEILAGRWKRDRGRLCASFRTTDGMGPYHTSVCLIDGMAVGQTWAEHRDFLFNWSASRPSAP